ncbi:MAG: PEFG-CTERM sorting domain-containing protein [Thaumarchaeota archaeon]|nr:PEFG-CTERM sorting domain-containing protein [Nitrososphaerota archaeon]
MNLVKIVIIFLVGTAFFINNAYGHGLGLDATTIDFDGKKILVNVELPLYFEEAENKKIRINAYDKETGTNVENITFLLALYHDSKLIVKDYFFAQDGSLSIDMITSETEPKISGQQDSFGAWYDSDSQPLQILSSSFDKGGLFHFEIDIISIDSITNELDRSMQVVDVSTVQTSHYDDDTTFQITSYFDNISYFDYKSDENVLEFEMPFDWNENNISHIPVVHEEVHFPKDYAKFLSPGYIGKVNGITLFKSSVTIDDYSDENNRIVHFVLLQDHLRFLKNELKKSGENIPSSIKFTLEPSQSVEFPLKSFTKNEEFSVDLSWEPIVIEPQQNVKFIFTIRSGATGEPLRQSTYDFVIIQNGKDIHKKSSIATVGGGFEEYTFLESQSGPTIIKFDNIRGSGSGTEFGLVVVPEFGTIVFLVFFVSIIGVLVINKTVFSRIHFR